MGQLPKGSILLIETIEDILRLQVNNPDKLSLVTQTTLSVDDTAEMVSILKKRFPNIVVPRSEDICYATTNRQEAVKKIANSCDIIIVFGAPNSSNSNRLVEVALKEGCPEAFLIEQVNTMDWGKISPNMILGVTAGASAPEKLVSDFIFQCKQRFEVEIQNISVRKESVSFNLPQMNLD